MHRLRTREAFHAAGPGSGREAVDAVKSDIGVERLAKLNDFVFPVLLRLFLVPDLGEDELEDFVELILAAVRENKLF